MEYGFTRPVDPAEPHLRRQLENRHRFVGTVVRRRGQATLPTLIGEPDKIKAKQLTGGLTLCRDGTGRPWVGKDEQLTRVERKCQETIDAAGVASD